jgi:hypothetical protein
MEQVTIWETLTDVTPQAIADLLADPRAGDTAPARSHRHSRNPESQLQPVWHTKPFVIM